MDLERLNRQQALWEDCFAHDPAMFGGEASLPAQRTAEALKLSRETAVLELGSGQGRDTFYFARLGCPVTALDYSGNGIRAIQETAAREGLPIRGLVHDVRLPLPLEDASFDLCYSHMLFCMALTTGELQALCREIRRVLRPGGHCVYTARNTRDPHFGKGLALGEGLYQKGAVVIHYFDREKIDLLAREGFSVTDVEEFEEAALPRILYRVTMERPAD